MTEDFNTLDPYVQEIVMEARRPVTIDAAARRRLMDAIRAEPVPARRGRLSLLFEPHRFSLPPIATVAMAAGLVGIGVLGGLAIHRDGRLPIERAPRVGVGYPRLPESVSPRAIKFVLVAPKAAHVSLVGDFNGWDASRNPMTAQGTDGTWTVFVPLQPGLHTYSFVVDGTNFVADPAAPIAPDDGYGHKSSLVLVGGSSS